VAFELETGERVEAGIKRIIDEQLASALTDLRSSDAKKADSAVHAARKRLKRIRALVRLVRQELGEETFNRENAAFRDAGGSLSEARDAAVLVATLDSLKSTVDPAAFAAARKKLLARRRAVARRVLQTGSALETVAVQIEAARQRVANWNIGHDGWDSLKPGLKHIYDQARAAYQCAEVGGQPELFHEWRKRVKDLWHQTEVLEAIWPEVMKSLADQFHALADILGEEHDLSVLKSVLEAEALARAEEVSAVAEAAGSKRAQRQQEAKSLGARIFAERPGAFTKRLGHYWTAWQCQAAKVQEEPAIDLSPPNAQDTPQSAPESIIEAGVSEEVVIPDQSPETLDAKQAG
jgi:CHAD domain-containing protein